MKRRLAHAVVAVLLAVGAGWWLWPTGLRPWRTIEWEGWQTSIQFTPDGRTLVAGSRAVSVVSVARDEPPGPIRVLPGSDPGGPPVPRTDDSMEFFAKAVIFRYVKIAPDGAAILASDACVSAEYDHPQVLRVWDLGSGHPRATLPITPGEFTWSDIRTDVRFADQGGEIRAARLMAGGPLVISRWETSSGHAMPLIVVAKVGVEPNLWADDGNVLVSFNDQRTKLLVRDLRTDGHRATFPAAQRADDTRRFVKVSTSREGWVVATTTTDGAVQFWDTRRDRLVTEVDADSARMGDGETTVEVDPTGRAVAVIAPSGPIRLWDVEAAEFTASIPVQRDQDAPLIAFSPDGRLLAVADAPLPRRDLWDRFQIHAAPLLGRIGLASLVPGPIPRPPDPKRVRAFDARTGERLAQFARGPDQLFGLVFSPDGRTLATHGNRFRGQATNLDPQNVTMLWDVPAPLKPPRPTP